MVFTWLDYLDIAEWLYRQGGSNKSKSVALYRSAVGRAYYGIFCHSRDFAEDYLHYIPEADGTDHHRVAFYYKQYNPKIGRLLLNLHSFRKRCDYDLVVTDEMNARNTRALLDSAKEIRDLIDMIPGRRSLR